MSYVVLTIVPRLIRRPKPGEDMATGIREVGCSVCVIRSYNDEFMVCWRHKDEHILWAEKADETEPGVSTETDVGVPYVEGAPRAEESLEIPV